jgi:hypothetical protein
VHFFLDKKLVEYEGIPENDVLSLLEEVATARKKVLMKTTSEEKH